MGQAEQIREVASAAVAGSGVVVEDVAVHPAGKRRLVRVGVARDVADLPSDDLTSTVEPLSLDEVAEASRAVGAAMDEVDPLGNSAYTLEVSSLGVDHPLTTPAQFRRNVGRLVKLEVSAPPASGEEAAQPAPTRASGITAGPIEGRLIEVGPDGIRLDEAPDDLLPYDRVSAAKVQVEFTRPGGKDD